MMPKMSELHLLFGQREEGETFELRLLINLFLFLASDDL